MSPSDDEFDAKRERYEKWRLFRRYGDKVPVIVALYQLRQARDECERVTGQEIRERMQVILNKRIKETYIYDPLNTLVCAGLIRIDEDEARGNNYRLTDKGRWLLNTHLAREADADLDD